MLLGGGSMAAAVQKINSSARRCNAVDTTKPFGAIQRLAVPPDGYPTRSKTMAGILRLVLCS